MKSQICQSHLSLIREISNKVYRTKSHTENPTHCLFSNYRNSKAQLADASDSRSSSRRRVAPASSRRPSRGRAISSGAPRRSSTARSASSRRGTPGAEARRTSAPRRRAAAASPRRRGTAAAPRASGIGSFASPPGSMDFALLDRGFVFSFFFLYSFNGCVTYRRDENRKIISFDTR